MKGYTDEKIDCSKRVKTKHYNMMSKYFSFIYFVWLLVWSLSDRDHTNKPNNCSTQEICDKVSANFKTHMIHTIISLI